MPNKKTPAFVIRALACTAAALALSCAHAQVRLADQPIVASKASNANVALALSVEWPTALGDAHKGTQFDPTYAYVGYFDPDKCYTWQADTVTSRDPSNWTNGSTITGYFKPTAKVTLSGSARQCSSAWSGNLLNFVTMQTIDIFRWAMTGGSRLVDKPFDSTDSSTQKVILQRAYASSQASSSVFPTKVLKSTVTGGTSKYIPFSYSGDISFTSLSLGNRFTLSRGSGSSAKTDTYNAYVEVCNTDSNLALLETNCQKYVNPNDKTKIAYKPEGLMQQYKSTFRFAAFGYLNDGTLTLDGGVMRAPMKSISVELTDMGGFVVNPDSTLASASSVSNSGAMNYLNNFGFYSRTYKQYDPVSELYAETIRYFRGYSTASATMIPSGTLSDTQKDGYPVVKDWTSYPAIKNYCDKNFVIGIGDTNTHADKNIKTADKTGNEPTSGVIDVGMDAAEWTNKVGAAEKMGNIASSQTISGDGTGYNFLGGGTTNYCCNKNGFYMAGIAYWANTNDVSDSFKEKQTVQTYWVDVLENGLYKNRNQFWLAAKYGGFSKKDADGKDVELKPTDLPTTDYSISASNEAARVEANKDWYTTNNVLTSGNTLLTQWMLPTNYYAASDAKKMVESLGKAFSNIKEKASSGTGVSAMSPYFASGVGQGAYQTSYDSSDWSGNVTKSVITGFNDSTGAAITEAGKGWTAQSVIDSQFGASNASNTAWDTSRRIVTYSVVTNGNTTTAQGVPFRYTSLNDTQKATLGLDSTEQQNVLNYLRGKQADQGKSLRKRTHLLGDIVNAKPVAVGIPAEKYSDDFNPGYGAFKVAQNGRTTMVYVAANDGMLHALHDSDGTEAWAYVPSYLFEGSVTENTNVRETDGLAALADASYSHHYYINATPAVRDVNFSRAGSLSWKTSTADPDWRTILVGGLGKGGKSYYALDVTTPPEATDSESDIASGTKKKVLWEFSDPDLGFSYGEPIIAKTERWGWVVIISSGYNNSDGLGYIFVLDPRDGTLLKKQATSAGTATDQAGLSQLTGFTRNYTDWTYREVYGADLKGNVWRFALPGSFDSAEAQGAGDITVTRLATLTDGTRPQSVTIPPWVDVVDGKRWIMVGTGRALDSSDLFAETGVANPTTQQRQTVYAIRDGNYETTFSADALPGGATYPISRTNLTAVSDITAGVSIASTSMGWYYDLPGTNSSNQTERIVSNFSVNGSLVMWLGSTPNGVDVCDPGWTTSIYVANMATGQSALVNSNGNIIAKITTSFAATGVVFGRVGNQIRIIVTDDKGNTQTVGEPLGGGSRPKFVNWRALGE
ncbi:MAG: PilC/PilY family type IV pilus protein [Rhodocyclaceae bacterium]